MNEVDISRILAGIKSIYGENRVHLSTFGIDLWEQALADLPGELVALVVKEWVQTEPFPPTVADIRGAIADQIAPVATEAEAYRCGMRWVRDQNTDGCPEFAIAAMKGVATRSQCRVMQEVDLRKAFGFAYRDAAKSERKAILRDLGRIAERHFGALPEGDRMDDASEDRMVRIGSKS